MGKLITAHRLTFVCGIIFCLVSNTFLAQEKPNIIFILADDLGYGDLSCYGATDLKTPNIDQLAQQGIQFTRAYANSTVCSPSRASILTGNYPDMVGVPGVIRDKAENSWGNLKDDIATLPLELKKLAYTTALIGKWHLGYKSPDLPNERGFDFFKGFLGDMMDDYYTHERAGVNWMRENQKPIVPSGHATDVFTDWSLEYLGKQEKQKQPFFLFLTYTAPHDPIQPPADWLAKVQKEQSHLSPKRQKLVALIEHLDFNVGRLIKELKRLQMDRNTIIIFTSDNGGALQYGARNLPYSGGKGDLLEGGIRVPCIVKLIDEPILKVVDTPLMLMDFFPTLLSKAGVEADKNLPSKCINELFDLPPDKFSRVMLWMRREGHKYGGRAYYAISDGTTKIVQNNPFSTYQIFDLENDAAEVAPFSFPVEKHFLWSNLMEHIQNSGKIPWQ